MERFKICGAFIFCESPAPHDHVINYGAKKILGAAHVGAQKQAAADPTMSKSLDIFQLPLVFGEEVGRLARSAPGRRQLIGLYFKKSSCSCSLFETKLSEFMQFYYQGYQAEERQPIVDLDIVLVLGEEDRYTFDTVRRQVSFPAISFEAELERSRLVNIYAATTDFVLPTLVIIDAHDGQVMNNNAAVEVVQAIGNGTAPRYVVQGWCPGNRHTGGCM